jgi:hypothetical protein
MVVGIFLGSSLLSDQALPVFEDVTGVSLASPVQQMATVLATIEVDED